MRPTTLLPLLALLASASGITAQESARPAPGNRVRVTAPTISAVPIVGTYTRMNADTLVLAVGERTRSFPRAAVTRLDISTGRKSNAGTGARTGSLVGAGIGALALGTSAVCKEEGVTTTCALVGGAAGGVAGLLIGAIIGAASKTDRWQAVPLDAPVSFLRRDNRRWLVGGTIRF